MTRTLQSRVPAWLEYRWEAIQYSVETNDAITTVSKYLPKRRDTAQSYYYKRQHYGTQLYSLSNFHSFKKFVYLNP